MSFSQNRFFLLSVFLATMVGSFLLSGPGSYIGAWKLASIVSVLGFSFQLVFSWISKSQRIKKPPAKSFVVWLTGFSGSGKSTLAKALASELRKKNLPVEELDGDVIRHIFPQTGFGRDDRNSHVKRIAHVASRLENHGINVVVSLISPYEESRNFARSLCKNFVEVHLSTALEVCEQRDPKGLYLKARRGEIKGFTGIDDAYEAPKHPELTIDTNSLCTKDCVQLILGKLQTLHQGDFDTKVNEAIKLSPEEVSPPNTGQEIRFS